MLVDIVPVLRVVGLATLCLASCFPLSASAWAVCLLGGWRWTWTTVTLCAVVLVTTAVIPVVPLLLRLVLILLVSSIPGLASSAWVRVMWVVRLLDRLRGVCLRLTLL